MTKSFKDNLGDSAEFFYPDGPGGGVPEAPDDGVQYGRQSKNWTPIEGTPAPDNGLRSISVDSTTQETLADLIGTSQSLIEKRGLNLQAVLDGGNSAINSNIEILNTSGDQGLDISGDDDEENLISSKTAGSGFHTETDRMANETPAGLRHTSAEVLATGTIKASADKGSSLTNVSLSFRINPDNAEPEIKADAPIGIAEDLNLKWNVADKSPQKLTLEKTLTPENEPEKVEAISVQEIPASFSNHKCYSGEDGLISDGLSHQYIQAITPPKDECVGKTNPRILGTVGYGTGSNYSPFYSLVREDARGPIQVYDTTATTLIPFPVELSALGPWYVRPDFTDGTSIGVQTSVNPETTLVLGDEGTDLGFKSLDRPVLITPQGNEEIALLSDIEDLPQPKTITTIGAIDKKETDTNVEIGLKVIGDFQAANFSLLGDPVWATPFRTQNKIISLIKVGDDAKLGTSLNNGLDWSFVDSPFGYKYANIFKSNDTIISWPEEATNMYAISRNYGENWNLVNFPEGNVQLVRKISRLGQYWVYIIENGMMALSTIDYWLNEANMQTNLINLQCIPYWSPELSKSFAILADGIYSVDDANLASQLNWDKVCDVQLTNPWFAQFDNKMLAYDETGRVLYSTNGTNWYEYDTISMPAGDTMTRWNGDQLHAGNYLGIDCIVFSSQSKAYISVNGLDFHELLTFDAQGEYFPVFTTSRWVMVNKVPLICKTGNLTGNTCIEYNEKTDVKILDGINNNTIDFYVTKSGWHQFQSYKDYHTTYPADMEVMLCTTSGTGIMPDSIVASLAPITIQTDGVQVFKASEKFWLEEGDVYKILGSVLFNSQDFHCKLVRLGERQKR